MRGDPEQAPDAPASPEAPQPEPKRKLIFHRLALAQAVLLVIMVIFALPLALRSMNTTLFNREARTLYNFPAETIVPAITEDLDTGTISFLNFAAVDIDEAAGSITFAVSGHRLCGATCPTLTFTLVSLDDDANVRRALPPSATITLQPDETVFTHTAVLPIRGQPSLYPFDDYDLWLGVAGTVNQNGTPVELTESMLANHAVITTQNQLRDYTMDPPTAIDPAKVSSPMDPYDFIGVERLVFERPDHQQILAVLLLILISSSAIIAVALRDISDLAFGIGSLVLAIWGVRSVLVPNPLPVVTSVDLALSIVILFVLLGLAVRAAIYFREQSGLPPLTSGWRRHDRS
ncbi:MAG: hypothetical protein U0031_18700 [Thermomicrobiales bacterium]